MFHKSYHRLTLYNTQSAKPERATSPGLAQHARSVPALGASKQAHASKSPKPEAHRGALPVSHFVTLATAVRCMLTSTGWLPGWPDLEELGVRSCGGISRSTYLHLRGLERLGWLTADIAPFYRAFAEEGAQYMHSGIGYTAAVLVQVEIVAPAPNACWVSLPPTLGTWRVAGPHRPCQDAPRSTSLSATSADTRAIAGIPHLIHDDPRAGF